MSNHTRSHTCKKCKKSFDYQVKDLSFVEGRSGGYDDILAKYCPYCGYGCTIAPSFPSNPIFTEYLKLKGWL